MKRFRPALALSATVLALSAAGCGKHESTTSSAPDLPPVRVRLVTVEARVQPNVIEVTGSVRPVQRATIAAKVMGTISGLPVALGQAVKRGDTLLVIAAPEISARVLQAKAQLNQAQRDLTRERTLLAQNASTPDMVKGLEDRVAMTEAMVREADAMLAYTTITAPFDGVIARKPVDVGDLAAPGMPLLDVEGVDAFEIEAGIPDSLAAQLAPGATLQVVVPNAGTTFAAKLTELSSTADAQARTVSARLAVPAGTKVRSGQFARVQVPGAATPALLVPATAITTLGQMERVFVAAEGRAVLRLVKTGTHRGDSVEILSGLAAGERIVAAPPAPLREGQPLEVAP